MALRQLAASVSTSGSFMGRALLAAPTSLTACGTGAISVGSLGAQTFSQVTALSVPGHASQRQSRRNIISVDVQGNKVDRALRQLRRKLIDEGIRETWMKQRVFVKPTHHRKKVLEDAQRKVRGEAFKEKMRWILRRKAAQY
jgi:ribosomal protein S21